MEYKLKKDPHRPGRAGLWADSGYFEKLVAAGDVNHCKKIRLKKLRSERRKKRKDIIS